jgi:hypothetical protein
MMFDDSTRSRLRTIVARIDDEIARLPRHGAADPRASASALRADWSELCTVMALGPEPILRHCPVCRHRGLQGARRCGYCWTKLEQASELLPP